jgi:hypothetical protein
MGTTYIKFVALLKYYILGFVPTNENVMSNIEGKLFSEIIIYAHMDLFTFYRPKTVI